MSESKKRGRPSKYTPEIAAEICERLASGESLVSICEDPLIPDHASVFRWLADPANDSFRESYARAREYWADAEFDNLMHIADTPMVGEKVKVNADGSEEVTRGDMIEHRRLQVDTRKWALARMRPLKYGERVSQDVQLTGAGGGAIHLFVEGVDPKPSD